MGQPAIAGGAIEGAGRKATVLIAVEPVLLEGALAVLIRRAQFADIVESHHCPAPFSRWYDAAVVSRPAPDGVLARVTIELTESGVGKTRVRLGEVSRWEMVESHRDLVEIVYRCCG